VAPAEVFAGLQRAAAGHCRKVAAAGDCGGGRRRLAALVSAERQPQGLAVMGKGLSQGLPLHKAQPSYQHDRTDCRLRSRRVATTELLHGLSIT